MWVDTVVLLSLGKRKATKKDEDLFHVVADTATVDECVSRQRIFHEVHELSMKDKDLPR